MLLLISFLHGLALFGLFLLGTHRTHLLWQFETKKGQFSKPKHRIISDILVQIPVYNEANVIESCMLAVSKLRWNTGQLTIQVLDDSTDDTSELIVKFIAQYDGPHSFLHSQRSSRVGYKAGALNSGMSGSQEPLIAIFDADFQPPIHFLEELTAHFHNDPDIGMVQGRWSHSNRNFNRLTQALAIVLDGHFVIEHSGRHLQDCFFNFNGTAGIWRRECIVDAGGWQWDTITEDLDLSYRAQLKGWRFKYTPLTSAHAEIPSTMTGLVVQQFRWAKGTTQTAVKILPMLWSSDESFRIKTEGTVHLTANLGYWLTLTLSLVLPYTHFLRWNLNSWWSVLDFGVFVSSFLALIIFHQRSQSFIQKWDPLSLLHWQNVIGALILGVGMAPFQSVAILEGLTSPDATFERTPKSGEHSRIRYANTPSTRRVQIAYATLFLGMYSSFGLLYTIYNGSWLSLPFQLIFSVGYVWVGASVVREAA